MVKCLLPLSPPPSFFVFGFVLFHFHFQISESGKQPWVAFFKFYTPVILKVAALQIGSCGF